jgi:hypothetical protein
MATKAAAKQPQPHDDLLQYAYTDSKGNHYFEFIHDGSMPFKRYVESQVTEKMIRLGFSQTGIEEIITVLKRQSIDGTRTAEQLRQDMTVIAANLEGRLGFLTTKKVYEQMASIFYLLEGEPLVPSDRWHMKKYDLWADDEAARDFFLHGAWQKVHGLANTSIADMLVSFKAAESREQSLPMLPGK